jgi:phosphoribosylformylglycinamidine synthase
VGLIPRDRIEKAARPGDAIVLIGGRTGRDGIHGATFSSAEFTDTHADEFAHAVQIGNAIEEKKILDVVLQARDYVDEEETPGSAAGGDREPRSGRTDHRESIRNPQSATRHRRCLYSAITDCGAGGLSSAVGEMGEAIGAEVNLETVPLKYAGLRYDEVWISEAQERMVLAVPPENVEAMLHLARREDVEATVIGRFTDTRRLIVRQAGEEVGNLDMEFLHRGLPKTTRRAEWRAEQAEKGDATAAPPSPRTQPPNETTPRPRPGAPGATIADELKRRLSDPTAASKHWIIRQYDHEVQAGSVVKPLAGPRHGPSDAAVLRPRLDSNRGIALGCGLAPQVADLDPYWMAVAAIDEAVRNVVCVGGDPEQTAMLDNFCWPRVDDPRSLGALVRACQACYDVAKAYGVPFISGKDSLNNEFALHGADADMLRTLFATRWPHVDSSLLERAAGASRPLRGDRLAIPYTLLISAVSVIGDVTRCVSMDLKQEQSQLYMIGQPTTFSPDDGSGRPSFDLALASHTHRTVARLIREGLVCAVHDVSDGGLLVACAEMSLAGGRGCRGHGLYDWLDEQDEISRSPVLRGGGGDDWRRFYFDASPALYVVEVRNSRYDDFARLVNDVPSLLLATVGEDSTAHECEFSFETLDERQPLASIPLAELENAWKSPLDW